MTELETLSAGQGSPAQCPVPWELAWRRLVCQAPDVQKLDRWVGSLVRFGRDQVACRVPAVQNRDRTAPLQRLLVAQGKHADRQLAARRKSGFASAVAENP